MNHSDYTIEALKTWTAPLRGTTEGRAYLAKGLLSEIGEVADVLKKADRNKLIPEEVRRRLVDEIGDVLWYAAIRDFERESDGEDYRDIPPLEPMFVRMMLSAFSLISFMEWAHATYGITREECRAANIAKLRDRAARGVITGEGGSR